MDDSWKMLIDLVGVTDNQWQTKESMDIFRDFVEMGGCIDKFTREIELERTGAGKNKLFKSSNYKLLLLL